jgi:hypothetical protein
MARKLGFVERESKLNGWKFLDMLLFTHFNHKGLSLNELAVQLKMRYNIDITKQGVNYRFSEAAVVFIKCILEKALKIVIEDETKLEFLKHFKRVKIKDSTAFQLPEDMAEKYPGSGGAGSKAMLRIQFEYDLKTGKIIDLSLHPFNAQDTANATETIGSVDQGELILRDLGYINLYSLKHIVKSNAAFLNRLQYSIVVYEKPEDEFIRIDFSKVEQYLKNTGQTRIEKKVYIGEKEKFEVRLIIELLPDDKKQDRLRKANKEANKKGRKLGKEYKSRCGLNLFITNINQSILKAGEVRRLYTLRWQVELIFKVWKSIGEIDKVKKMKVERFESYLYAKLLWIVINWKVFWEINIFCYSRKGILLSMYKMFKTFKNTLGEFRGAIIKGKKYLQEYIVDIALMAEKHYIIEKKKNKLSSRDLICDF